MKKKNSSRKIKEENGRRRINIVYKKILNETKLEEERNKILKEETRKKIFLEKKFEVLIREEDDLKSILTKNNWEKK